MNHAQRRREQRRGFSKKFSKHHRKPRSRGGTNEEKNISYVPTNTHQHYHALFANLMPEEIAKVLNDCWIDPDYRMVAVRV